MSGLGHNRKSVMAFRGQGKQAEADAVHEEFLAAWARSDTYLRSPVF